MIRLRALSVFLLFLLAVAAVALQPAAAQKGGLKETAASQAGGGPAATGHGTFRTEDGVVTLSFHAQQLKNGSVKGGGEFHFQELVEVNLHIDITCLTILPDGRTAVLSGVITRSSDPQFEGEFVYFTAVDNGEGPSAPPDGISGLQGSETPVDCGTVTPLATIPLEDGGNIQVRP